MSLVLMWASIQAPRAAPLPADHPTSPSKTSAGGRPHAPNLVKNGNFETGSPGPDHWEPFTKPGLDVADLGPPHGRVMRLTLDRPTARSTGLMYYSNPIPVTQGKTYRIRVDIRSEAPSVIIFVKGYATFRGQEREIYNRKKESLLPKGQWGTLDMTFTPRSPAGRQVLKRRGLEVPIVDRVKVELFAYNPEGTVYFDNVEVFEEPAASTSEKDPKDPHDEP